MLGLTPFNRNQIQKKSAFDMMDFYNLFDDFFEDAPIITRNMRYDTFKLDIKEEDEHLIVEAELPGVKKEEVKITFEDGRLVISVERNEEVNEEKENYIHRERRKSSAQRSIWLKDIDESQLEAEMDHGVLRIKAPKLSPTTKTREITIK